MANKSKDSSFDTSVEKKPRKRHKKLILEIGQQIEFYFSDANLRKDRFLKQEMARSKDGYVSVDIIASFNKLLSMTEDRKMVISAIQQSAILELSKDKQFVKRVEPLKPPKYDPDDCTVYVECLPKQTDHDWLRKTFSYCGKVVYVSLPRYKSTADIKGFAFIEFECPEEANRACKLMNNPPPDMMDRAGKFPKMRGNKRIVPLEFEHVTQGKGYLSINQPLTIPERVSKDSRTDCRVDSETGQGTGTEIQGLEDGGDQKRKRKFEEEDAEDKTVEQRKKIIDCQGDGTTDTKQRIVGTETSESSDDTQKGLKRKHPEEPIMESHKSLRKHTSSSESCDKDKEDAEERKRILLRDVKHKMMKRKRSLSEGDIWSLQDDELENDEEIDQGSKKVKKMKGGEAEDAKVEGAKEDDSLEKKKRNRKKKMKRIQEEEEAVFLRVMSKREWLLLKEEYLSLQKESLAQMKQARRMPYTMPVFRRGTPTPTQVSSSHTPNVASEGNPSDQVKLNEPVFTEGTVMTLECLQPTVSRKEVKECLQCISPVAYVDLPEGYTKGFVRFETAEGPKSVLLETNMAHLASEHISLSLVTGADEKAYWEKLSRDRQIKLNSKQKKKKKRGVNKNVQKAGQGSTKEKAHIRFDE